MILYHRNRWEANATASAVVTWVARLEALFRYWMFRISDFRIVKTQNPLRNQIFDQLAKFSAVI